MNELDFHSKEFLFLFCSCKTNHYCYIFISHIMLSTSTQKLPAKFKMSLLIKKDFKYTNYENPNFFVSILN